MELIVAYRNFAKEPKAELQMIELSNYLVTSKVIKTITA